MVDEAWQSKMAVRWFSLFVLCASLTLGSCARKEFGLSEMCWNLSTYFRLISSLVTFKAELDFKEGDRHLTGSGNAVFSQNLVIDECQAHKVNSKVFITATIKDDISIQFTNRPWVFLKNCFLDVKLISADVVIKSFGMKRTKHVTIPKVELGTLVSATVNGTELDFWSKKSIRKTLGTAFTEFASGVVYDLGAHDELGQTVATEALSSVLQYYLYRLQ